MTKRTIRIKVRGTQARAVDDPGVAELVSALSLRVTRERLSHVVPYNWALRAVFRLIRKCVVDTSEWAAWTRTWRVRWIACMVDGPVLGPFETRFTALEAERLWIADNKGM